MEYFVFLNEERKGPYTKEELANKYITSDVLVWHEGMEDWKKAGEVAELQDVIKQLPPTPPRFKFLKNWLTESIAATCGCAVLSYIPLFQLCLCGIPFGGIAIIKALKAQEFKQKNNEEMARHYAEEARKWMIWCLFAGAVACIFALLGWCLLFTFGIFIWNKIPF